jgi:tRNA(Ile)-lysidine synthase
VVTAIQDAVLTALPSVGRVVLAVSGGIDSMVLLDAAAARIPAERLHVATYDHGTGAAARAAAELVVDRSTELGVGVTVGRPTAELPRNEASWRAARWAFIAEAGEGAAAIATAHTRDDQVETVLFRAMRGAGARGLAGLRARTHLVRPVIGVERRDVTAYAGVRQLAWVDDPSNSTTDFARNRARLELLPALRRVRPSIDAELLEIGDRAALWRSMVESLVEATIPAEVVGGGGLEVPVAAVMGYSAEALGIIWPVLVARVGLAIDRRGIARLTAFTRDGHTGSRIQLSGGWTVRRRRDRFDICRTTGLGGSTARPGLPYLL